MFPTTFGSALMAAFTYGPLYGAIGSWSNGAGQQAADYLSPDGKLLTGVTDDLSTLNRIISTPDGKTLYISDLPASV